VLTPNGTRSFHNVTLVPLTVFPLPVPGLNNYLVSTFPSPQPSIIPPLFPHTTLPFSLQYQHLPMFRAKTPLITSPDLHTHHFHLVP
jgi:hypothetical protein